MICRPNNFVNLVVLEARHIKVTGNSLLIHEFACSVTSNMTSYSHLYHSIKLIHCGAPQKDVLSDKMVL